MNVCSEGVLYDFPPFQVFVAHFSKIQNLLAFFWSKYSLAYGVLTLLPTMHYSIPGVTQSILLTMVSLTEQTLGIHKLMHCGILSHQLYCKLHNCF